MSPFFQSSSEFHSQRPKKERSRGALYNHLRSFFIQNWLFFTSHLGSTSHKRLDFIDRKPSCFGNVAFWHAHGDEIAGYRRSHFCFALVETELFALVETVLFALRLALISAAFSPLFTHCRIVFFKEFAHRNPPLKSSESTLFLLKYFVPRDFVE